jgi:heme-binding NEAT domain protein
MTHHLTTTFHFEQISRHLGHRETKPNNEPNVVIKTHENGTDTNRPTPDKLQSSRAKLRKLESQFHAQIKTVEADSAALAKALQTGKQPAQSEPVQPGQPGVQQ